MLTRLEDVQPAEWLLPFTPCTPDGITSVPETYTVASCLPNAFEAYGKLFHPLYLDPDAPSDVSWASAPDASEAAFPTIGRLVSVGSGVDSDRPRARWADVARAYGLPYDSTLEDRKLQAAFPDRSWPRRIFGPNEGSLDLPTLRALLPHLQIEGSEPSFFYYDLLATVGNHEGGYLFTGLLEDVLTCFDLEEVRGVSPTFWWPSDRQWCVYTDWDLKWSYIGGSRAIIERLVTDSALECLEVGRDHPNYEPRASKQSEENAT